MAKDKHLRSFSCVFCFLVDLFVELLLRVYCLFLDLFAFVVDTFSHKLCLMGSLLVPASKKGFQ